MRWVFGLAAVTTAALGVIGLINSTWLDVNEVRVVGNDRADVEQVIAASGIAPGQPLIELDLDDAATRVADVPWIGSAWVHRDWNGHITIEVAERGPIAAVPATGGYALVDDRGRQLEIVDRRPDEHLPVSGVSASGVAGETVGPEVAPVLSVVRSLPVGFADRVVGIRVEASGVVLDLVGGGAVVLGDDRELGAKYQAIDTMLTRVELACLATVDVRVPAAPTLTRTGGSPADPAAVSSESDGGTAQEGANEEPQSDPAEC